MLFFDIRLVNRFCGLDLVRTEDLVTVNEGSLAEQFVEPQLLYWMREARNANAEVNFVIHSQQEMLPVEVKAGKTGRLRANPTEPLRRPSNWSALPTSVFT